MLCATYSGMIQPSSFQDFMTLKPSPESLQVRELGISSLRVVIWN